MTFDESFPAEFEEWNPLWLPPAPYMQANRLGEKNQSENTPQALEEKSFAQLCEKHWKLQLQDKQSKPSRIQKTGVHIFVESQEPPLIRIHLLLANVFQRSVKHVLHQAL